jgi:hypothetical protein
MEGYSSRVPKIPFLPAVLPMTKVRALLRDAMEFTALMDLIEFWEIAKIHLARPRLRPARGKDLKVALGAAPIGPSGLALAGPKFW